jgi:uncharacterized damage-inducible protein DinB
MNESSAGMPDALGRLLDHMEWADRAVLDAFRAAPPPDRALELYAHVLGAEHVWLARLRQEPPRLAVWPALAVADCAAASAENMDGYRRFLRDTGAGGVAREVPYTNSAGLHFRSRIDDIILHVALHGTYHRGQVALLVRAAGSAPAPTDYIGFVRGTPAATKDGTDGTDGTDRTDGTDGTDGRDRRMGG